MSRLGAARPLFDRPMFGRPCYSRPVYAAVGSESLLTPISATVGTDTVVIHMSGAMQAATGTASGGFVVYVYSEPTSFRIIYQKYTISEDYGLDYIALSNQNSISVTLLPYGISYGGSIPEIKATDGTSVPSFFLDGLEIIFSRTTFYEDDALLLRLI